MNHHDAIQKGLITFFLTIFLGTGAIYNQLENRKVNRLSETEFTLQKMNSVLQNREKRGYYPQNVYEVSQWLENENYHFSYSSTPLYAYDTTKNRIVSFSSTSNSVPLYKQEIDSVEHLHQVIAFIEKNHIQWSLLDIVNDLYQPISIDTQNHIALNFHQNKIYSLESGIEIFGSGSIEIRNAHIISNGSATAGIAIFESPQVQIKNCTIDASCYGISENPNLTHHPHVVIDNIQVRSPYPLYLCADGQYEINQSLFYGESVFSGGSFSIHRSQFLSETSLANLFDSDYVYQQYLQLKNRCESYGDSILIVNHRNSSSSIHSFKITDSNVYVPIRHYEPLGYGIRYIDFNPYLEESFSLPLELFNVSFSTLFSNSQKNISSIDIFYA